MAKRDSSSLNRGRNRQRTLSAIITILFVVVLGRLFDLQVVHHGEFARFAEDNQLQRERVPAPRGFIRDRTGRILVDNLLHFEISTSWHDRDDVAATVDRLATRLPVDTTRVMARFDAWREKNQGLAFPIIPDADKFVISFVRENTMDFPTLRVKSRARRRYREGMMAAHLLGYVGEASDADVAKKGPRRYFPGDMVGKSALERYCEEDLRGTDGQKVMEVNASGTLLGEVTELSIAPVPGADAYLTIDASLQKYLEDLLRPHGAGAAVVIDVHDGGILAAASLPQYDPNEFATGISQASLNALFNADDKPLFNRISQARYPPASTFKMVSTHAILTNGLVNPSEVLVYCVGGHPFGNRYFRCWQPAGHGSMNLMSAIVQSCDVYFYKVAESMDVDVLATSARAFGLGSPVSIDLPGEVSGLVPDREYYDRKFGKGRWTQGHMLNNIIGQGEYLVNLLQVVRMCAAIANGGYLVQPHVVDHIGDRAPVSYTKRRVPGMEGTIGRFLQRGMERVVDDPDGTAHWTRIPWLKTAGKTGTAQNPHGEHHAWYMAYAPADEPEIAIAIIIEHAGHGGEFAAPIARDFFIEYFRPLMQDQAASAQGKLGTPPGEVAP